jgi:exonuclease VII large subunit
MKFLKKVRNLKNLRKKLATADIAQIMADKVKQLDKIEARLYKKVFSEVDDRILEQHQLMVSRANTDFVLKLAYKDEETRKLVKKQNERVFSETAKIRSAIWNKETSPETFEAIEFCKQAWKSGLALVEKKGELK